MYKSRNNLLLKVTQLYQEYRITYIKEHLNNRNGVKLTDEFISTGQPKFTNDISIVAGEMVADLSIPIMEKCLKSLDDILQAFITHDEVKVSSYIKIDL